ncbi:hypothetical protein L6164_012654 [Bauhinia variegata]|uniref:Uncharacterized protein n=1 Tax=Bauhinia variegata TaxID=167791 RepID=A0ACB9PDK1_BAUVA|nr:hypothetical protein L6164_012654 [Bauhinia variegata]
MEFSDSIPQDLIEYCILSKLPGKSLARFRLVSEPWRDFIDKPRPSKVGVLLNRAPPRSLALVTLEGEDLVPKLTELDNDFKYTYNASIMGVCNGLFLIGISSMTYIMWNPFVEEYRQIHCPYWSHPYSFCGFGYNPASDEYKIVHVSYHENEKRTIEVLRFEHDGMKWKEIEEPFPYGLPTCSPGVVVNGAPHWVVGEGQHLSGEKPSKIIYFDVAEENFKDVPKPELGCPSCDFDVAALNGSLCVVAYWHEQEKKVEIWVMKEHGVAESWTKLAVIPRECEFFYPLSLVKENELLAEIDKSEVVVYDLKKETFKHVMFSDPVAKIREGPIFPPPVLHRFYQDDCKVATFVESFVNPATIGI